MAELEELTDLFLLAWEVRWEQSPPVDWIKDLVWNSHKVTNYDIYLKAGYCIDQNAMLFLCLIKLSKSF